MERPVELLPTEDLSPVLSGLVPCNPVALDIGGSLVKIVFWERENGPKLPDWVRPDTGPEHLPLRPLSRPSSPAPLTRTPSAGTLAWSPCVSPAASPAPDGTVTPTGTRRARFCDAHGFSVECLSHTRTSLFLSFSLSLSFTLSLRWLWGNGDSTKLQGCAAVHQVPRVVHPQVRAVAQEERAC